MIALEEEDCQFFNHQVWSFEETFLKPPAFGFQVWFQGFHFEEEKTSSLHIVCFNLLPSFWILHSLCEKVCLDYFLSGKGRSLTSWRSLHLCVRKIVVFNLFVAARDITLCRLQEDVEMKSLIEITFDKKKEVLHEFWWLYFWENNLQRWIGMF